DGTSKMRDASDPLTPTRFAPGPLIVVPLGIEMGPLVSRVVAPVSAGENVTLPPAATAARRLPAPLPPGWATSSADADPLAAIANASAIEARARCCRSIAVTIMMCCPCSSRHAHAWCVRQAFHQAIHRSRLAGAGESESKIESLCAIGVLDV